MHIGQAAAPTTVPRGWRIGLLSVLVLVPVILVAIAMAKGPGMSPDSVVYASTGHAFAATGQLENLFGRQLTIFPPGLPVLLGSAERIGIDPQAFVVVLNLTCLALAVLLTYLLASTVLRSPALALGCATFVSLSVATVRVFPMLWTEPLFTVIALLVLLVLCRAVRRKSIAWWEIAAVAALVSVGTTLRFVGIVLIPVVFLGVLAAARARGRGRSVGLALAGAALSSIGLVAVGLRNVSLGVPPLGERTAGVETLKSVLHETLGVVGGYLVPDRFVPNRDGTLLVVLGVIVLLLLGYAVVRAVVIRDASALLVASFVGLYGLSIWYSELATTIDPVDERLVAPMFSPIVILVVFAGSQAWRSAALRTPGRAPIAARVSLVALVSCLAICVALSVWQSVTFVSKAVSRGIGFNAPAALASPLARSLTALPAGATVATTDPWQAYWTSGHRPMRLIPLSERVGADAAATTAELATALDDGEVSYLAYFTSDVTDVTPDALGRAGARLRLVGTYSDGSLYAAVPRD